MRDHGEVVIKLLLELGQIPHVIDALVKPTGEFRRDGLQLHAFIGQRGENDQQFRRRLWRVGFVHGHFGDEIVLVRLNMAIDRSSLRHCPEVFTCNFLHVLA